MGLAQIPNFNRMLDSHGVDFEQITAGKHKRTVTMFGKNTDEDREKLREELEDVHALFKSAVSKYRPELDLEKVEDPCPGRSDDFFGGMVPASG